MEILPKLENPCAIKKDHCLNCHSHFMSIRPSIKAAIVSKRFIKDLKKEEAKSIVNEILDCSNIDYTELHKFEENIDGYLIFRAKKQGIHIVYCVDKGMQLIFLRAFKNYREYEKFLEDKKEIKRLISQAYRKKENKT
jgi:mRNA-degrading endonuclease RelE of RelBE toxin-antitoxin system